MLERLKQREKGMTEDEVVRWPHRLDGHEFEQTLGDSSGEGNGNPLQYACLENPMGREEPGRLQSMGSLRVRHD